VPLTLTIDRELEEPVSHQVAGQLRRLIASDELATGTALPSVRQLAGDLGVGLNTVARACRLLETEGSEEAPLTGGLADNEHWIWGVLYVDRKDPSVMVESRFGIGYTLSLGNRTALLVVIVFSAVSLGLALLVLTGLVT